MTVYRKVGDSIEGKRLNINSRNIKSRPPKPHPTLRIIYPYTFPDKTTQIIIKKCDKKLFSENSYVELEDGIEGNSVKCKFSKPYKPDHKDIINLSGRHKAIGKATKNGHYYSEVFQEINLAKICGVEGEQDLLNCIEKSIEHKPKKKPNKKIKKPKKNKKSKKSKKKR
ncbi:hypothetical protein KAJ27_21115 [bacterium]|nr:hypothetical protein [bacterium]